MIADGATGHRYGARRRQIVAARAGVTPLAGQRQLRALSG